MQQKVDYELKFKDFIATLTGKCFDVAEDVYAKVCDQVIEHLNDLTDESLSIDGDFPPSFTIFDKLSHRIQSYSYEEIGENLEETILQLIQEEVSRLSPAEKLVLELSTVEFTPDNQSDMTIVYNRLMACFKERLEERWEETAVIVGAAENGQE